MKQHINKLLVLFALIAVVFIANVSFATPYTDPAGPPDGNNTEQLIDTSNISNVKLGGLGVNAFAATQNSALNKQTFVKGLILGQNGIFNSTNIKFGGVDGTGVVRPVNVTVSGKVQATNGIASDSLANSGPLKQLCAANDGTIKICEAQVGGTVSNIKYLQLSGNGISTAGRITFDAVPGATEYKLHYRTMSGSFFSPSYGEWNAYTGHGGVQPGDTYFIPGGTAHYQVRIQAYAGSVKLSEGFLDTEPTWGFSSGIFGYAWPWTGINVAEGRSATPPDEYGYSDAGSSLYYIDNFQTLPGYWYASSTCSAAAGYQASANDTEDSVIQALAAKNNATVQPGIDKTNYHSYFELENNNSSFEAWLGKCI